MIMWVQSEFLISFQRKCNEQGELGRPRIQGIHHLDNCPDKAVSVLSWSQIISEHILNASSVLSAELCKSVCFFKSTPNVV